MSTERDQSNGFQAKLDPLIPSGIHPGQFARRIPLWKDGENVQFTDLGVRKINGYSLLVDPLNGEPVRGLCQYEKAPNVYVYMGDLTKLWEYEISNTALLDVSGTVYTLDEDSGFTIWDGGVTTWDGNTTFWDGGVVRATQWSIINYGSFIMATNGKDYPQIQKTRGSAFSNVAGLDVTTISIFQKLGPHVIGFNTSASGRELVWCDADDVDTWVAAADNLAGQLEIRELDTDIRAAVPLGNRIAVYGDDQMAIVNYLGNDLVFGYQMALNGIGAVSKSSVVAVGRQNYGLSNQGFFRTDGSGYEYIDEPSIRTWYKDNISSGQLAKATAFHDELNSQIRWSFPKDSGNNDYGVSFNYRNGTWSFLTGNFSYGQERKTTDAPIAGTEDGKIVLVSTGQNGVASTVLPAFICTKALDLDDVRVLKELDAIHIGFNGSGLKYEIGVSETEDGAITWTDQGAIASGFDVQHIRTAGRWVYFKFYSDTLNADWELMSLEIRGRLEGTR